MSRLLLALPLAGAVLGAPTFAHADAPDGLTRDGLTRDGVCVVVQDHAFEVGLLDSVDPAELQTADPTAAPGTPADAGHLLCTRSDDPRCSPLQASDTPSAPDLPARLEALPSSGPSLPVPALRPTTFGESTLLGPSLGPTASPFRPPPR